MQERPAESPPGLLLVNTGTPEAPEVPAVRRYLREFLLDPRVIDLPGWQRRLLVELIIVPRRAPRSTAAYRAIWTPGGSPLLVHGRALTARLREAVVPGGGFGEVALAMRYGRPSLAEGLAQLIRAGCGDVVLLPLFPQHAEASAGSAIAAARAAAATLCPAPALRVVPAFFDHPEYIAALAEHAREHLAGEEPERLIVSFHGLPLRQLRKQGVRGCLEQGCCEPLTPHNRSCYRAQCTATARLLARSLGLPAERCVLCFQSRMGRARWIGPDTEEVLAQLPRQGVRRAALISPSFVADCVETLEELALRAVQRFTRSGGGALRVIPSLNAVPRWVAALANIAREAGGATRA